MNSTTQMILTEKKNGTSITDIAKKLNAKGLRTPTKKKWNPWTVKYVLNKTLEKMTFEWAPIQVKGTPTFANVSGGDGGSKSTNILNEWTTRELALVFASDLDSPIKTKIARMFV